jgi:glycosyltransferase involved in cell wall biosynthesis
LKKASVSLFHPFSAQAIGLKEEDLYHSHSKAQELALRAIQNKADFSISIDYFTGKTLPYQKEIKGLKKQFWPVTSPLFKKKHAWRKQHSLWHYKFQKRQPQDLTIINMSGHGSAYTFKLARLIKSQGLQYIPMVGGIHMSFHKAALEYYQQAHHILVHTLVQKEELQKNNSFKNLDIRVLPLGVDTKSFRPSSNFKNQTTPEMYRLLQVGRISRLKQIELSLELIAYLNGKGVSTSLEIIGFFSDQLYLKELHALANTLGIEKQVFFVGAIKQEELVEYYQKADVLLTPSQHESFGMVMVEAMACGTAVVGLKGAGGTDEIIEHNHNGLLVEKEVFNQKILNLLQQPKELLVFQQNAVESVKKKWSLEMTASILEKSIKDGLHV